MKTLNDKDVYRIQNAYSIEITLDSITSDGQSLDKLPLFVYFETTLQPERYYDFARHADEELKFNTPKLLNMDCDTGNVIDEIELSWQMCFGDKEQAVCPDEYQLEWTFVNDYDDAFDLFIPEENLKYDFKYNSTRVTLKENKYRISNIFSHGYLLYRVRGMGKDMNDQSKIITGRWNMAKDNGLISDTENKVHITKEHEGNKNWQYNTTYSEDGKKKENIIYFDGSQRNRQSVTRINSDTTAIVGSNIYDSQGRAVITVLPVPVTQNGCPEKIVNGAIKYHSQFNRNERGKPYNRNDYDFYNDTTESICELKTAGMSPVSGASNYYSSENPLIDTTKVIPENYLPDAERYPFSQTEFTPDNTGRIRRQSGVGKELQLNSGHETRYLYGQPEQLELDRMFGAEAGDASHYQKNATVDPNGITSSSYVDMYGRVVATSLAGNVPADTNNQNILSPLASSDSAEKKLTVDLLGGKDALQGVSTSERRPIGRLYSLNTVTQTGDAIVFNKQKLITYESDYTFDYSLTNEPFTDPCLENNICFQCVYELEIKVTNECGEPVTPVNGNQPVKKQVGWFDKDSSGNILFISGCSDTLQGTFFHTAATTFTLHLIPGNYTIKKILRINKSARQFYVDKFLEEEKNNCVTPLKTFIDSAMAHIDTSDCYIDCESCVKSLGNREDWVSTGKGTVAQYEFLTDECRKPCKEITWCELAHGQMMQDVSPGGQYGYYLVRDTLIAPQYFGLSVFNDKNSLPKNNSGMGNWKKPRAVFENATLYGYFEEDGKNSTIVANITNEEYPLQDSGRYDIKAERYYYDIKKNEWYVEPQDLYFVKDFIKKWKPTWAFSLVSNHPEYGYYIACKAYSQKHKSEDFCFNENETEVKKTCPPDEKMTSDEFDALMNKTETFADAKLRGFINSGDKIADFLNETNKLYDPFMIKKSYYQNEPVTLDFNIYEKFHTKVYGNYYTVKVKTTCNPGVTVPEEDTCMNRKNLTMEEFAAYLARCGTIYSTELPGDNCISFGDVISGNSELTEKILNKEWVNFKNFYLSEKRLWQNKRGDLITLKKEPSYNDCIGNKEYESFWISEQYNPGSNWAETTMNEESQACGMRTWEKYVNKIKRFPNETELNTTKEKSDYQQYLATGQCPLAMQLEFLMNALTVRNELCDTNTDLKNYYEFTEELYRAVNGDTVGKKYISYQWTADTTQGNEMKINIVAENSAFISSQIFLTKNGISYWSQIKELRSLQFSYRRNGIDYFTIYAMVKDPAHPKKLIPAQITGSTTMNISACNFKYTCTANDFGMDMMNLWNELLRENKFNDCDIELSNTQKTEPFLTESIINTIGQSAIDLSWCRNTQQGVFPGDTTYLLYDTNNPSHRIKIKFTHFSPGNYFASDINNKIRTFSDIRGNHDHHFVVKGLDANGNEVAFIEGEIVLETGSGTKGITTGDCEMPEESGCEGLEYVVNHDLEKLLMKTIVKFSCDSVIDLMTQAEMTRLLRSYIVEDSVPSYGMCDTSGGMETVQFRLGENCNLKLEHKLRKDKPYVLFNNLETIGELMTIPPMTMDGNFYHFYTIGKFKNPNSAYPTRDTIYGESCFPIRDCNECETACKPCAPSTGTENLITHNNNLLCTDVELDFDPHFTESVCAGKYNSGIWYWGDSTASYRRTHTFKDTGERVITFVNVPLTNQCPLATSMSRKYKLVYNNDETSVCKDSQYIAKPIPPVKIDEECLNAYKKYITTTKNFYEFINSNPEYEKYRPNGIFTDTADFTKENLCYCVDKYTSMLETIMKKINMPEDYDIWNRYEMFDIAVMCHTDVQKGCIPPSPDTVRLPELPVDTVNDCVKQKLELALMYATYRYEQQLDSLTTEIASTYNRHCVSANEKFTVKYYDKEYHYTLYYYDQAGNLVKTVPPEGVELLSVTSSDDPLERAILRDRAENTQEVTTEHRMATSYEYNSEGSVTKQGLPDHDKINLWEYGKVDGIDKRIIPTAVQFVQNGNGYLSGTFKSPTNIPAGCIYKTTDGGSTWEKIENLSGTDINKVQMIDEQNGFAVGDEGKLLATYSGGASWYEISLENSENLNDLYFLDLQNGIIVGNNGTIINTKDGGKTFSKAKGNFQAVNFRSVTYVEGRYYVCGENTKGEGVIYTSPDGENFLEMKNFSADDLNAVHFVSLTTGYTAGTDGNLLKTVDRGNTWKLISTNFSNNFRKIYFKNEKEGIAILECTDTQTGENKLYTTGDSGKTWKNLNAGDEEFENFQFYENAKGYAIGKDGNIKRAILDNSFGLMNIPFKNTEDLIGVYFLNKKEGWISATNKLFYTENADSSVVEWKTYTHINGAFKKLFFTDKNTGVGLNVNEEMYKITYSANKKIYEYFKLAGNDKMVDFTIGNNKIVVLNKDGRLGFLDKNKIGSATAINYMSKKAGNPPTRAIEISMPADTLLITVGKGGEIIRGKINSNEVSWINVTWKIKPLPLKDIEAIQKDEIAVTGTNGALWRTMDASRWKKIKTETKVTINAIAEKNGNEGMLCGETGGLWKYDWNANPILTKISGTGNTNLNDVLIQSSGKVYAVGDKGKVWYIEDINAIDVSATNINATTINMVSSKPEPLEINFRGMSKMINSQTVITVGTNGAVYQYSAGSGAKVKDVYPGAINGIHFSDTQTGTAVGSKGLILQTGDGGKTWKRQKRKITAGITIPDLYGVWTNNATQAYIIGDNRFLGKIEGGTVKRVFGGGNAIEQLRDIELQKNGNGYIVGENGLCYRTKDGGLTWKLEKDGPDNFKTLHVFRDGGMIAAGQDGAVKYFTGKKWHTLTPPNSADINFTDCYFHDDKNGYLIGAYGKIFKITVEGTLPQGFKWFAKENVGEMEAEDLNELYIGVIGFSDRYHGFISGYENGSTVKGNYSRTLRDESEIYSGYYWYDRVGRLILSQNTKQFNKNPRAYSYTLYDGLGRIIETGEKTENNLQNELKFKDIFGTFVSGKYQPAVIDDEKYKRWLSEGARREVVHTYYDKTYIGSLPMTQENLRDRVSSVTLEEIGDTNVQTYNHATHYSYDIHGNVKTLLQDNPSMAIVETGWKPVSSTGTQRFKRIDYKYDLISGNVNEIKYQDKQPDAFYHKYEYDADNRITQLWTSKDNVLWDRDAKYFYYKHGPLARAEIGDLKVQGIDYAYTLNGWVKGVNSESLLAERDMGKDGANTTVNLNTNFGVDAFGYSLTYFENDYKPIVETPYRASFLADKTGSDLMNARNDLFNGNISAMVTGLTNLNGVSLPQGTAYRYDQLNRLKEMKAYNNIDVVNNKWVEASNLGVSEYNGMYHNTFEYDANGNILTQRRKDAKGNYIDNMTYRYAEQNGRRMQNRLYHVNDTVSSVTLADDIDDQGIFTSDRAKINVKNNYAYDEIGNLKKDSAEKIKEIKWNVSGKVKEIIRYAGSDTKNLKFDYDAMGNRIAKHVYNSAGKWENSTYYARDASGNIMSIYAYENDDSTQKQSFAQVEKVIYGSSRLGVDNTKVELIGVSATDTTHYIRILGLKYFEGVNHLGNVITTFSDRKVAVDEDGDGIANYWRAEVRSGSDYYPFGAPMEGRNFSVTDYRWGFNGQERVDEIAGEGNHNTAEFWEYGPRTGSRWQLDPLQPTKFPGWSPYSVLFNNPTRYIDPLGLSPDDHYVNNDGSMRTVQTDDNFDRFYVQDDNEESGFRLAGQLDKNNTGLVLFPNNGTGFERYGPLDAGGTSINPPENVGQGDHFLRPETAAALFGLTNYLNTNNDFTVSFGDMSSSNGSDPWQISFVTVDDDGHHRGHGHLGNRSGIDIDFRYLNTEGVSFQSNNAFNSTQFSTENNQTVYDVARTFGFTINYQGTSGNLTNVTRASGHNDHGHLGLNYGNLNWRYVQNAPVRQANTGFNFNLNNR
ncbi:MAG: hypothetical protein A3H98_10680 [Bacteroidetes bacterium RIFCSPLOWO2_02_FULL_36_8]|nr:MAG: hypothetical protein A3H98_10680 [Bacteroidetes bacterium RIFCSPLOWO2_02_FULL_36_8]OFY69764.1 MAG: hypothetical protein A3G23_11465 [Bacteroidetes bacterium RIFCSPLOWO2_12_FULL_37_12]